MHESGELKYGQKGQRVPPIAVVIIIIIIVVVFFKIIIFIRSKIIESYYMISITRVV